jgi:hypothetical protein
MVVIKIFGATVAQQASFSADASEWAPKPGKGVEAFGQHAGRGGASVGTRFWRPGRARSCGYCGTWGHPSADSSRRRGRGHRSRGRVIRGLCACPLVRASKPMVLDARPDRCAGVRHSVTAHASGRLRDFQGQAPEFKGIVANAMEMPQVRLMLWVAIGASRATRSSSARRRESSTWGGGYTRKREAGAGVEMEGR